MSKRTSLVYATALIWVILFGSCQADEKTPVKFTVTIQVSAGGMTDPSPGSYKYSAGTAIGISAIPSTGYKFNSWSGDTNSSSNPLSITVNSDLTIIAGFSIDTTTIAGTLVGCPGATLPPQALRIISPAGSVDLDASGAFSLQTSYAERYQIVLASSKTTDDPVYIGIYDPSTGAVSVSTSTTALALTLMNPYLLLTDQDQRAAYLSSVQQNPNFPALVAALTLAYQSDAGIALNYDANPNIYQLAVQVMTETMAGMARMSPVQAVGGILSPDPPTIADVSAGQIRVTNPRHVFYVGGVYSNNSEALNKLWDIPRTKRILDIIWGLPPKLTMEPITADFSLENGTFRIHLAKGLDFSKFIQLEDPVGRATTLNTGQGIIYLLDIVFGLPWNPVLLELPRHLVITYNDAWLLARAVTSGDALMYVKLLMHLVRTNAEGIAYWIFQSTASTATHSFIKGVSSLLENVSWALKILGFVNEQGPFFYDLLLAKDVTYNLTRQNGYTTSLQKNDPPVPEFTVDPPAGIVGTTFSFDASGTTDSNDAIDALGFRWDWESDGTWDTGWSGGYVTTHSFTESGSYAVAIEVRDSGGLTARKSHNVYVGAGQGTATHIKLFQDTLPWSTNSMVSVLTSLGFSPGAGPGTYEIVPSILMGSVPLVPSEDLVIISNDQNQAFYNNYAANQLRFGSFVYQGGSMLWEACDNGWAGGLISTAGIVLPGNILTTADLDYWNYLRNATLPLVAGLPQAMDHYWASHESFSNLPDGAIIYCVNESGNPTLIEYNLGAGWVILTGQPLEHQYIYLYGAPDMDRLLPRIVAYFTGNQIPNVRALSNEGRSLLNSNRPTNQSMAPARIPIK